MAFDFRIKLVYLFENIKYDKCNVMKLIRYVSDFEYLLKYPITIFYIQSKVCAFNVYIHVIEKEHKR